jgi:hypothetical protein
MLNLVQACKVYKDDRVFVLAFVRVAMAKMQLTRTQAIKLFLRLCDM